EELHLAPAYLVRLFKDATGLPPKAYLAQLRAQRAAGLLLHSDDPATSVGGAAARPRRPGHVYRPRRRLAGPELLRAPVQGALRAERHHLPQAVRHLRRRRGTAKAPGDASRARSAGCGRVTLSKPVTKGSYRMPRWPSSHGGRNFSEFSAP